jgi:hypothetical protein
VRRLWGQLPLPVSGEDDAVFIAEPEPARVHNPKTRRAALRRPPVGTGGSGSTRTLAVIHSPRFPVLNELAKQIEVTRQAVLDLRHDIAR